MGAWQVEVRAGQQQAQPPLQAAAAPPPAPPAQSPQLQPTCCTRELLHGRRLLRLLLGRALRAGRAGREVGGAVAAKRAGGPCGPHGPAARSRCPALPPAGRHHRLAARERRHGLYQRLLLVLGGCRAFGRSVQAPGTATEARKRRCELHKGCERVACWLLRSVLHRCASASPQRCSGSEGVLA